MLALRRIALRAFSGPVAGHSRTAQTVSTASRRAPYLTHFKPSAAAYTSRQWYSLDSRRPEAEAAETTAAAAEDGAPLRSEPPLDEIDRSREAPRTTGRDDLADGSMPFSRNPGFRTSRRPLTVEPNPQIYVGNLFYDITESDIKREFEKIGPIKKCELIYDRRGLSKGHAYVEYNSVEDAQRAIDELNQQVFEGRRMIVNFRIPAATPRPRYNAPSSAPSRTLFIGNMSYEMTDQDLNDVFRDIRNVVDVRVAIDRRTGTPKGFAHADFTDVSSAQEAMEQLQQKRIYGRSLRVDFSSSSREIGGTSRTEPSPEAAREEP